MKRITLLLLCSVFAVSFLFAEQRTISHAQQIATSFVQQMSVSKNVLQLKSNAVSDRLTLVHTSKSKLTKEPYFYVFEKGTKVGYVIISGDTRAEEILAYADNGRFDLNNMPPNMREWLGVYEQEMEALIKGKIVPRMASGVQGSRIQAAPKATSVEPLLGAMQWNQSAPYNNFCPMDGDYRSVTGCTPTAMAQVMRYHEHPVKGTGSKSYETLGQTLTVDFSQSTYDWANMSMQYGEHSTEAQENAVAHLMYDCGVSIETTYSSWASGAYLSEVGVALQTYFDYDDDIRELQYSNHTYAEWVNVFKQELNASRPILHVGYSMRSGHTFVCDGYDANDYFHFNWGWGGYCDGYFKLSALAPSGGGIGAGSADGYNGGRIILVGVRPNDGVPTTIETKVMSMEGQIIAPVSAHDRDSSFIVSMHNVFNRSTTNFTGVIGVALFSVDDVYLEMLSGGRQEGLQPNYGFGVLDFPAKIDASIAEGNYKIVPVYITDTTWEKMNVNPNAASYLDLSVTSDSIFISEPDEFEVNLSLLHLETETSLYQNRDAIFTFKIKNNGIEYMSNIFLEIGDATTSDKMLLPISSVTILSGDSIEVSLTEKMTLAPGTYNMQLYYDDTNSGGVPNTPFGDPIALTVMPEPTESPIISIPNPISFVDNNNVPNTGAELPVTFTNTGGYGVLTVYPHVFCGSSGKYIGTVMEVFTVVLDSNATKTYTIKGDIELPDGRYVLRLDYKKMEAGSWEDFGSNGIVYFTLNSGGESPNYSLSFDLNGGTGVADAMEVTQGEAIGTLPTVERAGYSFEGWQIDGEDITPTTVWNYTEDKTAVAQWKVAATVDVVDAVKLNLYPNPATERLTIDAAEDIDKVVVYNVYGGQVMVLDVNGQRVELYVDDLPLGIYLLRATLANKTEKYIKFVKE